MVAVVTLAAFVFKKFTNGKVGKQHYFTILWTALMVIALTIASFVFTKNGWLIGGFFNPMSLVIIAIYVISVFLTPATEEKDEEEKTTDSKLTIKQIWILFAIFSALLIGCSIAITYVADAVGDYLKLEKTFVGSLFLGIATSIPEVTATIALCSKKNFDAAYGDIFGSCVFNVIILGIADIFSFVPGQSIYFITNESFMLIVGTAFVLLLSLISILYIRSKYMKNNAVSRIVIYSIATLLIASYVVYLVLSGAKIEFPFLS